MQGTAKDLSKAVSEGFNNHSINPDEVCFQSQPYHMQVNELIGCSKPFIADFGLKLCSSCLFWLQQFYNGWKQFFFFPHLWLSNDMICFYSVLFSVYICFWKFIKHPISMSANTWLCPLNYFSYPNRSCVYHLVQVFQEATEDITNTLPMRVIHSSGDDDEQV
jgi:hypothetical protein